MATQQQPSEELSKTMIAALSLGTPEHALIKAVRTTTAQHIANGDSAPRARPRGRPVGSKTTTARPSRRASPAAGAAAPKRASRGRPRKTASTETMVEAQQQAG